MAKAKERKRSFQNNKLMRCKIIFMVFLFLLLPSVYAEKLNGTTYRQSVIVSSGGESSTSTTYKTSVATNIINSIISSTSYINSLGFFHTILLANNQPCTSASQCEGGFCCSSLCKSASCPVDSGGETPGGSSASSSGGGGGGGALIIPEETTAEVFTISPESIQEAIGLGASKTDTITIRNTGDSSLNFNLNILTVESVVSLSDSSFSLASGEEKKVDITITGVRIGSYFGEIQVETGGITKSLSVVIDVSSDQSLFDVKLDIPVAYKKVKAGTELRAQITLLNVGAAKKVDVTPTYIIKDKYGRFVYETSETFAVEKQMSYVKTFQLPEVMEPGDYVAVVEMRYSNLFAVSSDIFNVVNEKAGSSINFKSNIVLLMGIIVASLMILFVYLALFRKDSYK
ncbi:MAG TPA: hypothetical protein VJI97_02155 [Candidatus Nanoarchaeia archaeon]|nr:hypothetical protein [Candidatus Nanoarchaeia archaeon]